MTQQRSLKIEMSTNDDLAATMSINDQLIKSLSIDVVEIEFGVSSEMVIITFCFVRNFFLNSFAIGDCLFLWISIILDVGF
jgi:hypothetical protein